jgi:hypothetical protein
MFWTKWEFSLNFLYTSCHQRVALLLNDSVISNTNMAAEGTSEIKAILAPIM